MTLRFASEAEYLAFLKQRGAKVQVSTTNVVFAEERVRGRKPSPENVKSKAIVDDLVLDMMDAGLPEPEREHKFMKDRKYRFDCALLARKVAVEIDGIWAHRQPKNVERDRVKDGHALEHGWIVVRVTPKMVKSGAAVRAIKAAWEMRK